MMDQQITMKIEEKPKKKFLSLKLIGFALLLASFIFLFFYDVGIAIFLGFIILALLMIIKDNGVKK